MTQFKWSDLSKWLKGEHLDGQSHTVTIKAFTFEIVHQNGQPVKWSILYFEEWRPGLPLSTTNQDTLAALFGNIGNRALGQRVVITPVPMRVGGKDVIPVRISPVKTSGDATPDSGHPNAFDKFIQDAVKLHPKVYTGKEKIVAVLQECGFDSFDVKRLDEMKTALDTYARAYTDTPAPSGAEEQS